ncbi:tetratricopeptide repeat protein [Massilia sp. YIM B02443]|uniref:tetratricopeptide repeat protein n=1 Tax=Massilia sp. YIM B02443 TaxID=3050127 RepID=UPI0025B680C3|nr:hypothetical protein [Massilia sp. YIM B02443]MDN4037577.1 hypothetical protein [Massilia sp. YIM B02443]
MQFINIATAMTLTGWSERTFWRRFADGSVRRDTNSAAGKSMVEFDSIKPHMLIPLGADDYPLVQAADGGNAEAQTDLALLFISHHKLKQGVAWLEAAVKQEHAAAMRLMGRCHIEGQGVDQDDNLGMMWIARAAAKGDPIAQAQMGAILQKVVED